MSSTSYKNDRKVYSTRIYSTKNRGYENVNHICANCGKPGGSHFTSEGISWCYSMKDRMGLSKEEAPELHTAFAYHPDTLAKEDHHPNTPTEKRKPVNPNEAFRVDKAMGELKHEYNAFAKKYKIEKPFSSALGKHTEYPEEYETGKLLGDSLRKCVDDGDLGYDTLSRKPSQEERVISAENSLKEIECRCTPDGVEYYVNTTNLAQEGAKLRITESQAKSIMERYNGGTKFTRRTGE